MIHQELLAFFLTRTQYLSFPTKTLTRINLWFKTINRWNCEKKILSSSIIFCHNSELHLFSPNSSRTKSTTALFLTREIKWLHDLITPILHRDFSLLISGHSNNKEALSEVQKLIETKRY